MPASANRAQSVFATLDRQLRKLAAKPAPQAVHRFRTSGRRVEVLLEELGSNGNHRKLLKLLSRLRKKAGRVRDLDVQIALLRNFKMPEGARHKRQLLEALVEERNRKEKKFAEAADKNAMRDLRRRLKRAAREMQANQEAPWPRAVRLLGRLDQQNAPLTEKVLHQYRLAGKRIRYLAELADDEPQARSLVRQLKGMQDALGEWHDWLKLTQRAENALNSAPESPLVAALRNLTHAKFRLAVTALAEARSALAATAAAQAAPARKGPAGIPADKTAAA